MTRNQFLGAILAPVVLLFKRKEEKPNPVIKNYEFKKPKVLRVTTVEDMEPLGAEEAKAIWEAGPIRSGFVVWEQDPRGTRYIRTSEGLIEKGELKWAKFLE